MVETKYIGIKFIKDKAHCEQCNSDLTVNGSVECVAHLDGKDFYTNSYICKDCGNFISITRQRFSEIWS